MKKTIILGLLLSTILLTASCMSMFGMHGMQRNMNNDTHHRSELSQKSVFQNEDLVLDLTVPPLYRSVNSNIKFNIIYKTRIGEKNTYPLILSIWETDIDSTFTVAFDAEGKFFVDYVPMSVGTAKIIVKAAGDGQKDLISLNQKIDTYNYKSVFSNPGTYIIGGLVMSAIMVVMLLPN